MVSKSKTDANLVRTPLVFVPDEHRNLIRQALKTRGAPPPPPKLPRINSPTAQMYEIYYAASLRRRALRLALRSMNTSEGDFVVENCLATAEQEHHRERMMRYEARAELAAV